MNNSTDIDTNIIRMDELINDRDGEEDKALEDCDDVFDRIDELMDLAARASSKKKSLEYINAALELDPENLDIMFKKLQLTTKDIFAVKEGLEAILETGRRQMEEGGYFEDCVGDFWLVLETRPYMRIRREYISTLIDLGMMRKAAEQCRDMLRLCTGDNLGVRYCLMHIYAFFEDEAGAQELYKTFEEYIDVQLLMPMAILYFKLGELDKSKEYLLKAAECNKNVKKFLTMVSTGRSDDLFNDMTPYGYALGSLSELAMEMIEYSFLFESSSLFALWAKKQLPTPTKKKK